jgi:RNA polymerase primary sigma factor
VSDIQPRFHVKLEKQSLYDLFGHNLLRLARSLLFLVTQRDNLKSILGRIITVAKAKRTRISGNLENDYQENEFSNNGEFEVTNNHRENYKFSEDEDSGDDLEDLQNEAESDAIDDPVRMYLMQMGRIPLLTRQQEISAAIEIERTRTLFRNSMIATDFVLQGAIEALEKVRDGELRLDRTIEVSVTNTAEKKRILKRLTPNLVTLRHLLDCNRDDFRLAISKSTPMPERRAAWRRLVRRRNKAVRLIEELNLRINRLQPLFTHRLIE